MKPLIVTNNEEYGAPVILPRIRTSPMFKNRVRRLPLIPGNEFLI